LVPDNTDNKGVSYGSYENYLMRRATPFVDIVMYVVPFFVSRQVICGTGGSASAEAAAARASRSASGPTPSRPRWA
jgi:hypothetical protein